MLLEPLIIKAAGKLDREPCAVLVLYQRQRFDRREPRLEALPADVVPDDVETSVPDLFGRLRHAGTDYPERRQRIDDPQDPMCIVWRDLTRGDQTGRLFINRLKTGAKAPDIA